MWFHSYIWQVTPTRAHIETIDAIPKKRYIHCRVATR